MLKFPTQGEYHNLLLDMDILRSINWHTWP
jgi:hypothetical protein